MANLTVSSAVDTLMQATNQAGLRTALGLGTAATTNATAYATAAQGALADGALQAANNLSDVASATTARENLGLEIGAEVQAFSALLTAIAALTPADGNIIVGNGTTFVAESGSTARASIGAMSATEPYHIQVALSANGSNIAAGAKKGVCRVPKAGNITAFVVDCDPANEPSAAAVQVDLNKIDRSTGTATTVLSAVAEIATSANTSTGGTINGTQAVSAGDMLTLDIDQGSDGRELIATITITPT